MFPDSLDVIHPIWTPWTQGIFPENSPKISESHQKYKL